MDTGEKVSIRVRSNKERMNAFKIKCKEMDLKPGEVLADEIKEFLRGEYKDNPEFINKMNHVNDDVLRGPVGDLIVSLEKEDLDKIEDIFANKGVSYVDIYSCPLVNFLEKELKDGIYYIKENLGKTLVATYEGDVTDEQRLSKEKEYNDSEWKKGNINYVVFEPEEKPDFTTKYYLSGTKKFNCGKLEVGKSYIVKNGKPVMQALQPPKSDYEKAKVAFKENLKKMSKEIENKVKK